MRLLAQHGSRATHLGDGWGVAFHAGDDALLIKQPEPAEESAWVGFLETQRVRSRVVLSHIRRATQGEVSLRNTQPFARELGGRMHVFAHNGRMAGIEQRFGGSCRRFRPIGSTDSEVAFCILMDRMSDLWSAPAAPSPAERLVVVADLAADMREFGPANFLYTDGDLLFAHGHRRTQPDGTIAPPGLTMLTRRCAMDPDALATAGVGLGDAQLVTLFASVPLTNEAWQPLSEGEIVVVSNGEPLVTRRG
jgi:predicted glutamine amidotransferase